MFIIRKTVSNKYCIIYKNDTKIYISDYYVAALLKSVVPGIALEEYQNILTKYNGSIKHNVYFKNREDIEKCVEYLNNTYGIILKLLE